MGNQPLKIHKTRQKPVRLEVIVRLDGKEILLKPADIDPRMAKFLYGHAGWKEAFFTDIFYTGHNHKMLKELWYSVFFPEQE